jgi:hypothetical protein
MQGRSTLWGANYSGELRREKYTQILADYQMKSQPFFHSMPAGLWFDL